MDDQIKVGAQVRLINLPKWLLEDLPLDEQENLLRCIGKETVVQEIDDHGYFWLGFNHTLVETIGNDTFAGPYFCVPREYLELA